jgi:hypothetical protein
LRRIAARAACSRRSLELASRVLPASADWEAGFTGKAGLTRPQGRLLSHARPGTRSAGQVGMNGP